MPRLHRRLHHLGQFALVLFQRRGVRGAVLEAVAQLAVGVEVEGGRARCPAADQHHAARAQRMAHTQLVPDVGIVEGEVGHHEVGDQQFLEHVGANVAGALFFVSAKDMSPAARSAGLMSSS